MNKPGRAKNAEGVVWEEDSGQARSRGAFAKVYRSLWDGTLAQRPDGWAMFVFLLAHADRSGVVDMTPAAISARSGIPLDRVRAALSELEEPDAESRSSSEEGRRIVRLEERRTWGWRIVNYEPYRNSTVSERVSEHRFRARTSGGNTQKRDVTRSNTMKREVTDCNHAEAEAEEEAEESEDNSKPCIVSKRIRSIAKMSTARSAPEPATFPPWYDAFPRHVGRRTAARAYAAALRRGATAELLLAGAQRFAQASIPQDPHFVKHPATWLNGDHWLDEQPSDNGTGLSPKEKAEWDQREAAAIARERRP